MIRPLTASSAHPCICTTLTCTTLTCTTLTCPAPSTQVWTQWNHDEFGFQKLRPYVSPLASWVVRWHSFVPLVEGKLDHVLTRRERSFMPALRTLWEYDHKTKSTFRVPEINLSEARAVVDWGFSGQTIRF